MKTIPSTRLRSGRVLLCLGTAVVLAAAAPAPAFAAPETSVPDDGSRPNGDAGDTGTEQVPSSGDSPVAGPGVSRGPYADKIAEQTKDLADLGDSTNLAEEEATTRADQTKSAQQTWSDLHDEAEQMADLAADMLSQDYQSSAADVKGVTDEFDSLFDVKPELLGYDESAIADEADDAASDAAIAQASLDASQASQSIAESDFDDLATQLDDATTKLEKLIADNAEEIAVEDAKNEADNQANYDLDDLGKDVDGWRASKDAQKAVEYAVEQVGKPYEWGAEGPDSFDCSGLMQAAYASRNVTIPRIANEQYRDTKDQSVDVGQALPGDMIFYGDSPGDWTSVYHVAMYIGDGKMVQAPRPGENVKVSAVDFDGFFGIHRAVKAVQVDGDDKAKASDKKSQPKDKPKSDEKSATRDETASPDDDASEDSPATGDGPTPKPTPTPTPTS